MKELIENIRGLMRTRISSIIDKKIYEFESFKDKNIKKIFRELCFCIMTANCSAEKCIQIHDKIGNGFLTLSENQLSLKFQNLGYRFPNIRAKFIIMARNKIFELEDALKKYNSNDLRFWISHNILGLGYKETSHFLRNIGYKDYAIIDFHIIDILISNNIIEKPTTLSKKKYIEIENILRGMANKLKLTLAELDLYLWFIETGKILK